MQYSYLIFFILFCFCKNINPKESKAQTVINNDSIYVVQHNLLANIDEMDSSKVANRCIEFSLFQLNQSNGASMKIDTVMNKDGLARAICLNQGNLFEDKETHAILEFNFIDDNFYLIFHKNNGQWIFQDKFDDYNYRSDSTFLIRDVNFDGYNDFLADWGYSSGNCNCGFGCYNLYLYDVKKKKLVANNSFDNYLDVAIDEQKQELIVGEHCENFYQKCKWNKKEDSLIIFESVSFESDKRSHEYSKKCIRKRYKHLGKHKKLIEIQKSCELPSDFEAIFEKERRYLKWE